MRHAPGFLQFDTITVAYTQHCIPNPSPMKRSNLRVFRTDAYVNDFRARRVLNLVSHYCSLYDSERVRIALIL